MKEHKKLGQKQVSKMTLHFVCGHFSRKQTVLLVNNFENKCSLKKSGVRMQSNVREPDGQKIIDLPVGQIPHQGNPFRLCLPQQSLVPVSNL